MAKPLVEMVLIPAGEFMMGALPDDEHAKDWEKPCHRVKITKDFYVGKYPVTQKAWEAVMENNPSKYKVKNRPVEQVRWFDCILFCNQLSELEGKQPVYQGLEGYQIGQQFTDKNPFGDSDTASKIAENIVCNWEADGYRLLTEAEWAYCARSGEEYLYAGSNNLDEVGWYSENANRRTQLVGKKKPNAFGLYDMSGNVQEHVWDWFDENLYGSRSGEVISDPRGPDKGLRKVLRGCSYAHWHPKDLRISSRQRLSLTWGDSYSTNGLRVARGKSGDGKVF